MLHLGCAEGAGTIRFAKRARARPSDPRYAGMIPGYCDLPCKNSVQVVAAMGANVISRPDGRRQHLAVLSSGPFTQVVVRRQYRAHLC